MNQPEVTPVVWSRGVRTLLAGAAFVVIAAGLRAAAPIVVPVLLALFVAVITAPVLYWLQRRGVPKIVALLTVIAAVTIALTALVVLLGSSIAEFSGNLPKYRDELDANLAGIVKWLEGQGMHVEAPLEEQFFESADAFAMISTLLSGLAAGLSNAFLVLLIIIFILMEASSFPSKLNAMSHGSHDAQRSFDRIITEIRRYMAAKTGISLATGVFIGSWLTILGVPYAVLWGILAFLFNFVPNIGSIIAAIPAVILAFLEHGFWTAALTATGYLAVNVVIGNFIEPRLMGRRLGLSTLVVFLSLVFWGWLLGPVGMLLSVPLTMTMKIVLELTPETRWIAILLGSEATPTHPPPLAEDAL